MTEDLLQQAVGLAKVDARRPKQANLRRAISAAYYALFHSVLANSELSITGAHSWRRQ